MTGRALIVVDVQKDFCEGGALEVLGGNQVAFDIANHINDSKKFYIKYDEIVFTKDWHNPPPDDNGGHFEDPPDYKDTWPVHCVRNSEGAAFHLMLHKVFIDHGIDYTEKIFYKGMGKPDYSGFQGMNSMGTPLGEYLKERDITRVAVCGIAGEFCVKQTALSAVDEGFDVHVLKNLVASIGGPSATKKMIQEINEYQLSKLLGLTGSG